MSAPRLSNPSGPASRRPLRDVTGQANNTLTPSLASRCTRESLLSQEKTDGQDRTGAAERAHFHTIGHGDRGESSTRTLHHPAELSARTLHHPAELSARTLHHPAELSARTLHHPAELSARTLHHPAELSARTLHHHRELSTRTLHRHQEHDGEESFPSSPVPHYNTDETLPSGGQPEDKAFIGPWRLCEVLGRGAAGVVRRCVHRETGQVAAVKVIGKRSTHLIQAGSLNNLDRWDRSRPERINGELRMPVAIEREVAILKLIQHPHVVKLYDVWESNDMM
jgi:hypothetical protein